MAAAAAQKAKVQDTKEAAPDQIWSATNSYFETLARANQAWFFGLAEVGQEVLAFTGERLRQRLVQSEELMHCKDLEDAIRIQVEHTQSATADYLAEADKLFSLAGRINQDVWSTLNSDADPAPNPGRGARRA